MVFFLLNIINLIKTFQWFFVFESYCSSCSKINFGIKFVLFIIFTFYLILLASFLLRVFSLLTEWVDYCYLQLFYLLQLFYCYFGSLIESILHCLAYFLVFSFRTISDSMRIWSLYLILQIKVFMEFFDI